VGAAGFGWRWVDTAGLGWRWVDAAGLGRVEEDDAVG